jgi:hypothetical protein
VQYTDVSELLCPSGFGLYGRKAWCDGERPN